MGHLLPASHRLGALHLFFNLYRLAVLPCLKDRDPEAEIPGLGRGRPEIKVEVSLA